VADWREMVSEFCRLELTFETDRLPAIATLSQGMRALRGNDVYVAGMWKNSILNDLCWTYLAPTPDTVQARTAPTWSWASVPGYKVHWMKPNFGKLARLVSTVKFLYLSFTSVGSANVGEVTGARLTLEAPTLAIDLTEVIYNE
jgi:hypothetical protein